MNSLRRLLSILLLAGFLLPLLAPMLASAQQDESRLPACCRRNGKHHCMMGLSERGKAASQPAFQAPIEKCPYCPAAFVSAHVNSWGMPGTAEAVFAAVVSHPSGSPQTESKRRISRDRSRQKRGPPVISLS